MVCINVPAARWRHYVAPEKCIMHFMYVLKWRPLCAPHCYLNIERKGNQMSNDVNFFSIFLSLPASFIHHSVYCTQLTLFILYTIGIRLIYLLGGSPEHILCINRVCSFADLLCRSVHSILASRKRITIFCTMCILVNEKLFSNFILFRLSLSTSFL